jgi:hypothetical protein
MNETKLFRIRIKDGLVSPVTPGITNLHGTDMANVIVPAAVAHAVIKGKVNYKDAVRCVAAGKDPTVLLNDPDAVKPREALEKAPDFDQKTVASAPVTDPTAPTVSELAAARAEGRAPDLAKLTDEELSEQATLVGVDPSGYKTQAGLVRAVQKAMDAAAK